MKNKYRILFMGTPDFALPSLEALCNNGYTPLALYTQPDRINGRGKKINFSPVKAFGIAHDIPVFQPSTLKSEEEQNRLKELKPDLLIVIAYGKILPKEVLDIPTYGAINVHGSLLPRYRGAAPIQRALIDGEKKTGVTIMQLDEGMDTGNMVEVREMAIPPHMNCGELFDELSRMGAEGLISVMNDLPRKLAHSVPQNHELATYAEKVTKEMGHIDWTMDASRIDCLIRGMNPNPGTYTFYNGKRVKIHEAFPEEGAGTAGTVLSLEKGIIHVACGRGAIGISLLQPENHKKMSSSDFINGYQVNVNDKFGE